NNDGHTALHASASDGHIDVAQILLQEGSEIGAKTFKGETALHLAVSRGHEHIAKLLLENGADPTAKRYDGRTPLHLAAKIGNKQLTQLLVREAKLDPKNSKNSTLIMRAAENGHEPVVRLLLEHGA
ncbi:ankyrin, partial [Byssothecium circinans]